MKFEASIATDVGYKSVVLNAVSSQEAASYLERHYDCNIVTIKPLVPHDGKLYIHCQDHKLSVHLKEGVRKMHVVRAHAYGNTRKEVIEKMHNFLTNSILCLGDYRRTEPYYKEHSIYKSLDRMATSLESGVPIHQIVAASFKIVCTINAHHEPVEIIL